MNTPRHPVYWPKMKIRGAKRKYLAKLRIERRIWTRGFIVQTEEHGLFKMQFEVNPLGNYSIQLKYYSDGFGRSVR